MPSLLRELGILFPVKDGPRAIAPFIIGPPLQYHRQRSRRKGSFAFILPRFPWPGASSARASLGGIPRCLSPHRYSDAEREGRQPLDARREAYSLHSIQKGPGNPLPGGTRSHSAFLALPQALASWESRPAMSMRWTPLVAERAGWSPV